MQRTRPFLIGIYDFFLSSHYHQQLAAVADLHESCSLKRLLFDGIENILRMTKS